MMTDAELREFLDSKCDQYNRPEFIETDPIQVPHQFTRKEDIEIAGFFTACLSWGQRTLIIRNSNALMRLMDCNPYEFTLQATDADLCRLDNFCHRTFKGIDARFFTLALRNIYKSHCGLESVFHQGFMQNGDAGKALDYFRRVFFELPYPPRTMKHIADVSRGSSAKRLNMFLRWMVRNDRRGVDFGMWTSISPSLLKIPLDLHTGNTARKLMLLHRRQNDWQAVCELTARLRQFDPADPVKYDFALFSLGAIEKF
jgi:uncharacterized protein (TIGR02757 family)